MQATQPSNKQLSRLVVETSKYVGKEPGDSLPVSEIIAQGKANGYEKQEVWAFLSNDGLASAPKVLVPEQGELLGELWTQLPNPQPTVDEFCLWLEGKREQAHPFPLQHNWSHRVARRRFARAKDVDRYFWDTYDEFTTVLLTRTSDENVEPLLEQTEELSPNSYKQTRRRLLNRLSGDSEYAAVVVKAPKYNLPNPQPTVRSHVHEAYWVPGFHSADEFELLLSKHGEKVPGATSGDCIVQQHSTDTYPTLSQRSGVDSVRGGTTALPYELAENLPLMDAERDASDLYDDRALEWCAILSAGSDGSHSTKGATCWQPLGCFRECADEVEATYWRKAERDLRDWKHRLQREGPYRLYNSHPD